MRSALLPMTRTAEPGASRLASRVAAACADVTTSGAAAGTPNPASWAATAAGVREALLVTKASRMPDPAALASASGAPGTAAGPT